MRQSRGLQPPQQGGEHHFRCWPSAAHAREYQPLIVPQLQCLAKYLHSPIRQRDTVRTPCLHPGGRNLPGG